MRSLSSIIRADYLQRARSYAFLVTLLASIGLSYTFLPTHDAGYSTVRVGEYVGKNNAAWVGHVTAIMASTFLWLIGFYLVNNGIRRDIETGVGQIIATTSISNFKYLFAKTLSNFLVLLTIVFIVMIMALSLVFIRGSAHSFSISQFLLPYLFATLPSIFFVSALAVFTEVIFGKYTILQNISFFLLFTAIVGSINAGQSENYNWLDILGTKELTDGITDVVNSAHTDAKRAVSVGFIFGGQDKKKFFLFEGTHWTGMYIATRFFWAAIAFILVFISAKLFHRFDVKEGFSLKRKKPAIPEVENNKPIKEVYLPALPVAEPSFGILPFIKTEFLLLIRKGPRWFWIINAVGFIALFFVPLKEAHLIGLPLLWFLQVNRWADIATKEKYYGTNYFTYADFQPLQRLLTSQILAGASLAAIMALPLIFRYATQGDFSSVTSILLGALFVVAFSVCSGIVTGGKRFFEIIYFMLVYSNLSAVPYADYFGGLNYGMSYNLILGAIICGMLLVAYAARGYEIRNQ